MSKWHFWKSDADVAGARQDLVKAKASRQDAERLHGEADKTGQKLTVALDSNGFGEALTRLYRAK